MTCRAGVTAANFDGRSFNTILRNRYGVIQSYQRRNPFTLATQTLPMTAAYYRIHQTRAISGSTLPANTGCALADPARQIGCLVEASPCSIGYSDSVALFDPLTGSGDTNRKALGLRSRVPGANVAIFPTLENIRLALRPSGAACSPDAALNGGYEDRYPLARPLYLCTIDGIPGFAGAGNWYDTGSQTSGQLGAQGELASCFQHRGVVDSAARAANLITLDDTGSTPIPFLTCADMGM